MPQSNTCKLFCRERVHSYPGACTFPNCCFEMLGLQPRRNLRQSNAALATEEFPQAQ